MLVTRGFLDVTIFRLSEMKKCRIIRYYPSKVCDEGEEKGGEKKILVGYDFVTAKKWREILSYSIERV